jgi:hypothetical protein
MMNQDGKFFCNGCKKQIAFDNQATQVFVVLVKGGSDRHYCEDCVGWARKLPRRALSLAHSKQYPQDPPDS